MRPLVSICAFALGLSAALSTQAAAPDAPYKVMRSIQAGGDGGFDYVYADPVGRRLYIDRSGPTARVTVFDLDTLAPVGQIAGVNGHGAAVDPRAGHGFASSKPVAMWDTRSLALIKTIDVQGNPDGILGDPASQRIYILSHVAPNVTVIDAATGSVAGTIDVGGAPEQAVSDGAGRLFVDVEDKDQVAVIDTKAMSKVGAYGLGGMCGTPAGLAFDVKNHVLFVACRNPATMTMLNSDTGQILASLPIGTGVDGAVFNPATMEAFSSQADGTLTVVKEISPTRFAVEQTLATQVSGKTLTLDARTNRILIIAAEFGPAPAGATAPNGRPVRGPMLPDSFRILEVGR